MKQPPAKSIACRRCKELFLCEPKEDWEYNEKGDDRFIGYYYNNKCSKCAEIEAGLHIESREWGEALYDDGLITMAELDARWPKD